MTVHTTEAATIPSLPDPRQRHFWRVRWSYPRGHHRHQNGKVHDLLFARESTAWCWLLSVESHGATAELVEGVSDV